MKIAIVDDFEPDAQKLSDYIVRYSEDARLLLELERFPSGDALIASLSHGAPGYDIIFLDIYMDGLSGMDTAHRLRDLEQNSLLIFISSSAEHAVESYRVRAFDYLIKPFSYEQLSRTLRLCDDVLLRQARYIEVKEGRLFVKIMLCDILYTDYFNHYIHIHTRQRVVRSYLPFAEFSQLLLPYPQFICCYRNCIVNLDAVTAIDDKDFIVEGGDRVPMARVQRAALRQTYMDYAFRRLQQPSANAAAIPAAPVPKP